MSFIRETPLGDVLRMLGASESLQHPESVPGFLPKSHTHHSDSESEIKVLAQSAEENGQHVKETDDVVLVDWYDDEDSANPRNWAARKKAWVAFVILYVDYAVVFAGSSADECIAS